MMVRAFDKSTSSIEGALVKRFNDVQKKTGLTQCLLSEAEKLGRYG